MFTGIVDHCGEIEEIISDQNCSTLVVSSQFDDLTLGESIAIDGACLTVTNIHDGAFKVELSPETMKLTTASSYQKGTPLNLERSLRLMDRLGGHFVTGHVDGLAKVASITPCNDFIEIHFEGVASAHKNLLVTKGSVAVNGVSLTLNEITPSGFAVMLIPHTLQRTNLGNLKVGAHVNIEYDYLAKLVMNQINSEQCHEK